MQPTYTYRAVVEKVVDGDSIDFRVDLGFRVEIFIRTRLYGLGAPEVSTAEFVVKSVPSAIAVLDTLS